MSKDVVIEMSVLGLGVDLLKLFYYNVQHAKEHQLWHRH